MTVVVTSYSERERRDIENNLNKTFVNFRQNFLGKRSDKVGSFFI